MKNNLIVGAFLILLIVSTIILIIRDDFNPKLSKKQDYVETCISNLQHLDITKNQKRDACNCSHDYLFEKYGKEIYLESFIVSTTEDSLALVKCMLKILDADSINSRTILDKMHQESKK